MSQKISPLQLILLLQIRVIEDWIAISQREFVTMKLIKSYPQLPWSMIGLSNNIKISFDTIKNNPTFTWNYCTIIQRPDITWEIIQTNPQIQWPIRFFSTNVNLTWTIVLNNPTVDWNWYIISGRKKKGELLL